MKIAIQGIAGSFHDIAARRYYGMHGDGTGIELLECDTFHDLCQAVQNQSADAAMMAIENTIAGSILSNYALLDTHQLFITGEAYVQIQHHLLALSGQTIQDIKTVQAHPMALLQCTDFFRKYPHIHVEEANDTAAVAKKIRDESLKGVAAIAGYAAAELYGMGILAERIENNTKNYTRFLAISRTPNFTSKDHNKASLSLRVSHTSGTLAEALIVLKHNHINLTKIQSIPIVGLPYEYSIHIDMTWEDYTDYEHAIQELGKQALEIRIFGVYKEGEKNLELTAQKSYAKVIEKTQPTAQAKSDGGKVDIEIDHWKNWVPKAPNAPSEDYLLIAGPCSAETEPQLLQTARDIAALGKTSILRAGVWKPRTRAGGFEGMGTTALAWLKRVKEETGLMIGVEVATGQHVEECLQYGMDIVWIGARTTGNPFSVQEIADAVRGTNLAVMVKNPISPDLELWIGAMERVSLAGIKKLVAIHRGFGTQEKTELRNPPAWSIPMQFRARLPHIPMINDPSHITGRRDKLAEIAQKSLDLGMNGLIIESHLDPDNAWTDAKQQITPKVLGEMLDGLTWRPESNDDGLATEEYTKLEILRSSIDRLDNEFLELLASRMNVVREIGEYKQQNGLEVLQEARWKDLMEKRLSVGGKLNLGDTFIKDMFDRLHTESLETQSSIHSK